MKFVPQAQVKFAPKDASLKLEWEQEKQSCELFFASDKLENLA